MEYTEQCFSFSISFTKREKKINFDTCTMCLVLRFLRFQYFCATFFLFLFSSSWSDLIICFHSAFIIFLLQFLFHFHRWCLRLHIVRQVVLLTWNEFILNKINNQKLNSYCYLHLESQIHPSNWWFSLVSHFDCLLCCVVGTFFAITILYAHKSHLYTNSPLHSTLKTNVCDYFAKSKAFNQKIHNK